MNDECEQCDDCFTDLPTGRWVNVVSSSGNSGMKWITTNPNSERCSEFSQKENK